MSQQYPAMPQYGTGYQIPQPYSLFPTNVSQTSPQSSIYQQSMIQTPQQQTPTAQANDLRYNANMQIATQGSPFPFPPSFNPDVLKHFPPPPPSMANFNSNPGTPVQFAHFSAQSAGIPPGFGQQSYAGVPDGYPKGPKELNQYTPATTQSYQTATHNSHYDFAQMAQQNTPQDLNHTQGYYGDRTVDPYAPTELQEYQPSLEIQAQPSLDNDADSDMYDPANAFRIRPDEVSAPINSSRKSISHEPPPTKVTHSQSRDHVAGVAVGFNAELKEKAKAAILAMSSHKITYGQLVAEGLDANLLEMLFAELGLDKTIERLISPQPNTKEVQVTPTTNQSKTTSTEKYQASNDSRVAQQPGTKSTEQHTTANSAMERKDRIAQLLAAKAAKGGMVGNVSPSASPASASDSATQHRNTLDAATRTAKAQTGEQARDITDATVLTTQQLAQLSDVLGGSLKDTAGSLSAASAVKLLPTPIRESLVQNGLPSLIPGLFEDGDEKQPKGIQSPLGGDSESRDAPDSKPVVTPSNSIAKRPLDLSQDPHQRASKRLIISEERFLPAEKQMSGSESGEASEGEIVEDEFDQHARLGDQLQRDLRNSDQNNSGSFVGKPEKKAPHTEAVRSKPASSPRPISRLTPTQLAERAAQLKADLLRQRRIRQQQLSEGMPVLDDEVLKTHQHIEQSKIKLAEVRDLLQKYEIEAARARESERDILEEIQRLETQLQAGMNGQQRFSEELKSIKSQNGEMLPAIDKVPLEEAKLSMVQPPISTSAVEGGIQGVLKMSSAMKQNTSPKNSPSLEVRPNSRDQSDIYSHKSNQEAAAESEPQSGIDGANRAERKETLLDNLGSANSFPQTATPQSTDHNSLADDHSTSADESDIKSQDSRMSIDEESEDDSAGSASMSDSGSEEYEPTELDRTGPLAQVHDEDESDEYEPDDDAMVLSQPDENSSNHEASGLNGAKLKTDRPDDSNSQPLEKSHIMHDAGVNDQPEHADQQTTTQILGPTTHTASDSGLGGIQLVDGQVSAVTNPLMSAQEIGAAILGEDNNRSTSPHYVPYQSPLSSFKSYRFHPSFNEQVKSGYRSLTYSNNIDPRTPICPTELSGQPCQDPNCEEQHFGTMALSDDKILVQMSSANDIADKPLRDEYLSGLKQVIASLRQEGVKDFSEVANALSRYRRDWVVTHLEV